MYRVVCIQYVKPQYSGTGSVVKKKISMEDHALVQDSVKFSDSATMYEKVSLSIAPEKSI